MGDQLTEFADKGQKAQAATDYELFAHAVRAAKNNLVPQRRKVGSSGEHWQIHRGKIIVNYYPSKKTIFIDLRKGPENNPASYTGSIEDAIAAAKLGRKP